MLVDVAQRFFGVALGEQIAVHRRLDHGLVPQQRQGRPLVPVEALAIPVAQLACHVVAVRNAEVRVEAMPGGQEFRLVAQVPLADDGGGVTRGAQQFGDGELVRVQPERRDRAQDQAVARVRVQADALRIAARHQARPRGSAYARAGIEMSQLAALAGHPVQARRPVVPRAEGLRVAVAEVVGQQQDYVRRARLRRHRKQGGQQDRSAQQRDHAKRSSMTVPPKSVSFSWRPLCRYQSWFWSKPSACKMLA